MLGPAGPPSTGPAGTLPTVRCLMPPEQLCWLPLWLPVHPGKQWLMLSVCSNSAATQASAVPGKDSRTSHVCCYCFFSVHQGPAIQQGLLLGLPESPSGTIADHSACTRYCLVWMPPGRGFRGVPGRMGAERWASAGEKALSSSFWPARPGE